MTIRSWLKLTIALWLLRKAVRLVGWLLLAMLAVAAWPVTVVTVTGYTAAWLRGWPPGRLGRAAAAALPFTAIWLAASMVHDHGWQAGLVTGNWEQGWHHLAAAGVTRTFVLLSPLAVPAGLALAALVWAWRIYAITTGIGGWTASAPMTFDARQWKRQVRTARARTAAPGAVPLATSSGQIPVGGTIRTIGHRWHPVFTIPHTACARHMVIVGATGSGKTNLMIRLQSGWFTAARQHGQHPLLVVLDCKGGRDARRKADRTRRLLYAAGAARVAIWPDQATLSLWDLPAEQLAVLLYQMIETGDGAAAYYADVMAAALTLAVTAPAGPPSTPPRSWTASTPAGSRPRGTPGGTPPRRPGSAPPPGTCPTSSSATPPCSAASAPPWTAPAPSKTPTPGTSSSKAPANPPSPKPRPWP